MNQLDNKLIENALALTGKTMEDMQSGFVGEYEVEWKFSIEKFSYYILSPDFIKAYPSEHYRGPFGQYITEYQSGNEKPLIKLLQKIK